MLEGYLQWVLLAGILLVVFRKLSEGGHGGREFRLGVAADPALRQLQVRLDALLSRLQRESGFEEQPHSKAELAIAVGVLDGLTARLHFLSRPTAGDVYDLVVRIELPGALSHGLTIRREDVRSAVQQRLSGPDFEVGDAEADRELFIDGDAAELAALLDPEVVEELRWLTAYGGGVQRGSVELTLAGDPEHGFHQEGLLRAMRLARALSLRVGQRSLRLAEHLAPSFPAALRLAAAEALCQRHAAGLHGASAEQTLLDLMDGGDESQRGRAARALAQLRQARGMSPEAGGLAVHEDEAADGALSIADGGSLALSETPEK